MEGCSDIRIFNILYRTKIAFALSRIESDGSRPQIQNYYGSHDSFIFYPSNLNISIADKLQFYQDIWGSKNLVIDELVNQGLKVFNPSLQISTVHMNASNVREENRKWIGNHTYGNMDEFINTNAYCPPVLLNIYF